MIIANSEAITKYFGYWPEFCDAKLEKLSFEALGIIELSVFYSDVELDKSARIGLRFEGVTKIELHEMRSQNVIDEIKIQPGSPFEVKIASAFGLYGQFSCASVAVTHVRA